MSAASGKTCARVGCTDLVKKSTAKYCSVRCCAQDPERHERLRRSARGLRIYPMAHQLSISFSAHAGSEAMLDRIGVVREDVPLGMHRLQAG